MTHPRSLSVDDAAITFAERPADLMGGFTAGANDGPESSTPGTERRKSSSQTIWANAAGAPSSTGRL